MEYNLVRSGRGQVGEEKRENWLQNHRYWQEDVGHLVTVFMMQFLPRFSSMTLEILWVCSSLLKTVIKGLPWRSCMWMNQIRAGQEFPSLAGPLEQCWWLNCVCGFLIRGVCGQERGIVFVACFHYGEEMPYLLLQLQIGILAHRLKVWHHELLSTIQQLLLISAHGDVGYVDLSKAASYHDAVSVPKMCL